MVHYSKAQLPLSYLRSKAYISVRLPTDQPTDRHTNSIHATKKKKKKVTTKKKKGDEKKTKMEKKTMR